MFVSLENLHLLEIYLKMKKKNTKILSAIQMFIIKSSLIKIKIQVRPLQYNMKCICKRISGEFMKE